jgi:arylformamidase
VAAEPAFDPWLQAEYDNLARVPEHPAIIARWYAAAAAWRAAAPLAELEVAYGPSERQRLDLFWPNADRAAPIALFIHGGYWQKLEKAAFSHCARGLNLRGVAVAVVGYDLCPAVTLGEIVDQMRAVACFLRARHGGPLLAMGHSAGGHLSAMLLAGGEAQAALPISGVFELAPLRATRIGTALALDAAGAEALSPRFLPAPGRPLHAVVGAAESDEFLRQTREFAAAWGGAWDALPGLNHFTVLDPLADPDSGLVGRALALAG